MTRYDILILGVLVAGGLGVLLSIWSARRNPRGVGRARPLPSKRIRPRASTADMHASDRVERSPGAPGSWDPGPEDSARIPRTWRDLGQSELKSVEDRVAALPMLPTLTASLLAMLQDPATEPKEVARVASTDPAIATEILRAVNSAYFALREPCSEVDRAILLLGYNWIRFLVIRLGVAPPGRQDPIRTAAMGALWHHSFMTSESVGLILRHFTRIQSPEASTAALLHDLGRMVPFCFPNDPTPVNPGSIFEAAGTPPADRPFIEEDLFDGLNHCVVGALVADHLHLPPLVRKVIAHHHHPVHAIWNLPAEEAVIQVIAAVKLGDVVAHAFAERLMPQHAAARGRPLMEPDIHEFKMFFPQLPEFSVLFSSLEPELRKSHQFLSAFMPSRGASIDDSPSKGDGDRSVTVTDRSRTDFSPVIGPPTTGAHGTGDVIHATESLADGSIGWICIQGGSPGTWRAFGGGGVGDSQPVADPLQRAPALSPVAPVPEPPVQEHDWEDQRLRALFSQYLDARKSHGESVSHVTWERFARSIGTRYPDGSKAHEFRVVVRDDRVAVVARRRDDPGGPGRRE